MNRFNLVVISACIFLNINSSQAQSSKKLAEKILNDPKLDTVLEKAKQLLSKGFNAGDGYPQVWIRDLNTFIEISCEVYDHKIIRDNLLTFLYLQQPNGEIVDGYALKGHVTWGDPNIYTSSYDTLHVGFKNTVETDQETSLIQAIGKYITITHDTSILNENIAGMPVLAHLGRSLDYLLKHRYSKKYKLLIGATTQDWGDVQIEGGAIVDVDKNTDWAIDIYDNAMFVIALKEMIRFNRDPAEKKKWWDLKELTEQSIRKYLWNSAMHKFIPHIYINNSPFPNNFDEDKIYFHGGTSLAIEAGLLSDKEIELVNDDMLRNVKLSGALSIGLSLYPPYRDGIIKGANTCKLYVYQNGGDWTWFGGRMIQQLIAHSFVQQAYDELRPMVDRVVKNKKFYEWYSVDGKPSGSADFKGSAGVLGKAIEMLRAWAKTQ